MPHTEGKWEVFTVEGRPRLVFLPDGDEGFEISAEGSMDWIAYVQHAENVPLFLAAPQMLEALEAYVEAWSTTKKLEDALQLAKSAIAAAKGVAS